METVKTHIGNIQPGDAVLCKDNHIRTVNKNDIKYDKFIGITIFGDSYNLGTKLVEKVTKI